MLLPVTFVQNRVEMIQFVTTVTLQGATVVLLTVLVTCVQVDKICLETAYDGHLIVRALKSEFGKVRMIPQNIEKYLSLTSGQLQFLDSFQST